MVATSGVRLPRKENDLGGVRTHVEMLRTQGRTAEALDLLFELLSHLREDNDHLRVRLQGALRRLFGRRSEQLSADELQGVLEGILGVGAALSATDTSLPATDPSGAPASEPAAPSSEPAAPSSEPAGPTPPGAGGRPKTPGHGRGERPTGLPVERHRRYLSEEERRCPCCQRDVKVFDVEERWSIEYRPGSFFIELYECEKGACPHCSEAGVVQAQAPAKPLPGGQPGAGLLAKILVDKAEDALPLNRQVTRMAREGLTVVDTTLQGWWDGATDLLAPLVVRQLETILEQPVVQLDGSRLPVLDRAHPKGLHRGTVWPVVATDVGVVFTYQHVRGDGLQAIFDLVVERRTPVDAATSATVLFPPRFIVDGEGALASRIAAAGLLPPQLSGMHARRKFKQALDAGDTRATVGLVLFRKLFDLERLATEQGLDPEARRALRERQSGPVLEELRVWVLGLLPKVAPRTPLGKALRYNAERWLNLCVYLYDGQIAFDTGEVERRIRRLAVGRNNYLFAGSDEGARRLCIALSLCGSCRMLGLEPWAYLRDVLTALAEGATGDQLDAWLPAAWLKKQAEKAQKPDSNGG